MIGTSSVGAAAAGLAGCGSTERSAAEESASLGTAASRGDLSPYAADVVERVGVQLYTLRDLMEDEVSGTLEAVADVGYETVETAGRHGLSPRAFRRMLDQHGLRSPSGHYDLAAIRADLDGVAETARALGQEYVVAPWIDAEVRRSLDDYRALADEFNQIGEQLQNAGLQFGYHNHDFEFDALGGDQPAYDVLVQRTDADLVTLELDVYWIYAAGYDPVAYFERYPGRFGLAHLKGGAAPPEREMVNVGAGVIDFPALLAQAQEAGLEYAFVEHDEPDDALASIRASYAYLNAL